MPVLSLMSLNLLGKIGFGALGGFEYVAIHAGECRDPVRAISRSVLVAAPVIAVMFILGTSSMLALIGQVIAARSLQFDLFQQATVQPAVDFSRLEIVLVITNFRPVDISPLQPTLTP